MHCSAVQKIMGGISAARVRVLVKFVREGRAWLWRRRLSVLTAAVRDRRETTAALRGT